MKKTKKNEVKTEKVWDAALIILVILCCLMFLPDRHGDVYEIEPVKYVAGMAAYSRPVTIERPKQTLLGSYELTAYCSCAACCGVETGLTSSGTHVEEGRTVACNSLPAGTRIHIDGFGDYVVEDTGYLADNVIDIYIGDHNRAWEFGRQIRDVYLIND